MNTQVATKTTGRRRRRELLEAVKAGKTLAQIARDRGETYDAIRGAWRKIAAKDPSLPVPARANRHHHAQHEAVLRLAMQRMSCVLIALELGMSESSVQHIKRALRKAGHDLPPIHTGRKSGTMMIAVDQDTLAAFGGRGRFHRIVRALAKEPVVQANLLDEHA